MPVRSLLASRSWDRRDVIAWLTDTRVRGNRRDRLKAGVVHFGLGGLCALLVLATGGQISALAAASVVVVIAVILVVCVFWVNWLSDRVYHVLAVFGSLIVGLAMVGVRGGVFPFAVAAFFVFPIDFAALFFSTSMLAVQVVIAMSVDIGVLFGLGNSLSVVAGQAVVLVLVLVGAGGIVRHLSGQLRRAALLDALTSLPNRRALSIRARQETAHAGTGHHLGLLLLDLDRFKEVNDTLGHAAGDQVLTEIAARLQQALGPRDVASRLGGDEFVLLMPGLATPGIAEDAAHTLLEGLRSEPLTVDGVRLDLDFSIGVAVGPEDGDEFGTLLQHADVAMYHAKAERGRVARYNADNDENDRDRLSLVPELRAALASAGAGGLSVAYQPKASLPSAAVQGVEALLRWTHPTRGPIAPDEFVPVAEQTGLIWGLTCWVLDQVCQQITRWVAAGHLLTVAINVPARVLLDPRFPDEVRDCAARHGISPAMLAVEITERSLIEDPERARQALGILSALGVRLSLDDFGTGYSSLAYLGRLPLDEIKIDRCFVSGMSTVASDAAIVRATVDLGRSLGLRVVAEGVEDARTYHDLALLGCDVVQGFYFARPMPAVDVGTWLSGVHQGGTSRTALPLDH